MMLTAHPGYHTCNEGLQGNSEPDVMEAGGGTAEPEMLKLGGERGWWEARRHWEDEDGGPGLRCGVGEG